MNKLIKKLNNLKHTESFIQGHTIKGFKFLDKPGELINIYHNEDNPPDKFSLNPDGLIVENPFKKNSIIKITPDFIWMSFSKIDSLDNVSQIFNKELTKIAKVLDVEKLSRFGWRNYFVYEFKDDNQYETFSKRIKLIENSETEFFRVKFKTNQDFEGALFVQPLIKKDNPETKAVLFDIDLYKKAAIKIDSISDLSNKFRKYLQSETDFLAIINSILS